MILASWVGVQLLTGLVSASRTREKSRQQDTDGYLQDRAEAVVGFDELRGHPGLIEVLKDHLCHILVYVPL